jgi:hypothetical protein
MKTIDSSFRLGNPALIFLALLLASCGGGGSSQQATTPSITVISDSGPGDVDAVFPLDVGDTWNYRVTEIDDINGLAQSLEYTNSARVAAILPVSGVLAAAVVEDNPDNGGIPVSTYYQAISGGVINWGNTDAEDPLTPSLVPYTEFVFPAVPGTRFTKFNAAGTGYDFDGDTVGDPFSTSSVVNVTAIEDVTTPAGLFTGTRRLEEDLVLDVTASATGDRATVTANIIGSYAPSVGKVRELATIRTQVNGFEALDSVTTELIGFDVNGERRGIQPEFLIDHHNAESACSPAVGFDGTRFLTVFLVGSGPTAQLAGKFISIDGQQSDVFFITDGSVYIENCGDGTAMSLAFDGTNFLLVLRRTTRIYGIRIATDGTVLDPAGGFQISDVSHPENDNAPVVKFDGTNYLVVWYRANAWQSTLGISIHGAFVSTSGVPGDVFTIASDTLTEKAFASLDYDGSNYLAAWVDQRNTAANSTHIYAARITAQGTVLDPEGFPVTETTSSKYMPQVKFDGNYHRVSWWDQIPGQKRQFYKKRITPAGINLDLPTSSNGLTVVTRNVARIGTVVIGGDRYIDVWPATTGNYSSVVSTGTLSIVVYERAGRLYGAFVYPL